MESSQTNARRLRAKRVLRVRNKVRGNQRRPRLCVVKTNRHIYVQLIDDETTSTLASTSSISGDFRTTEFNRRNQGSAKQLGHKIAELAKARAVEAVVFDRGSAKYHGVVAAVADGAREGGLKF